MLEQYINKCYEEIKYPYTKVNISYKLFKYSKFMLVLYFIESYIPLLMRYIDKIRGDEIGYKIYLTKDFSGQFIFGTIFIVTFIISIIFRKKI